MNTLGVVKMTAFLKIDFCFLTAFCEDQELCCMFSPLHFESLLIVDSLENMGKE